MRRRERSEISPYLEKTDTSPIPYPPTMPKDISQRVNPATTAASDKHPVAKRYRDQTGRTCRGEDSAEAAAEASAALITQVTGTFTTILDTQNHHLRL
mmetsp:Transcript_1442/g.4616  ORF Transcript_1442/g.4616 Transcript_1442/m.4616 type:complete len:98 (+) Transcript_1442:3888-4181(+)